MRLQLDQRVSRYGKDGRFLVTPGIRACLARGIDGLGAHADTLHAVFQFGC